MNLEVSMVMKKLRRKPISLKTIIRQLQGRGVRMTRVRKEVLEMVMAAGRPVGAFQVLEQLHRHNVLVNKTTVYRELAFLVGEGVLRQVHTKQKAVLYEPADRPHHHHLICTTCGSMEGVRLPEMEQRLRKLEESVQLTGFAVKEHALEFYGTCGNCR
jgi:Fe2+ or Zn2+ uptake regulation protein